MNEETTGFEDAFGDGPVVETTESAPSETVEDAQVTTASEGDGSEDQQAETQGKGDSADSKDEPSQIPIAALKDERSKRQNAEKELEGLKARLAELEKAKEEQGQDPDEEDGDFWDDPDAALDKKIIEMRQEVHKANFKAFAALAKNRHGEEKFDRAFSRFSEMSKQDPNLFQKMTQADDPAEFIFKEGNKALKFDEIGDPTTYRDRIIAEYEAEKAKAQAEETDIPGSMIDVKSYGGNSKSIKVSEDPNRAFDSVF